ncbi:MAG: hypothetical protein ACREIT_06275 [Tepidisphaeraceae bacterium]
MIVETPLKPLAGVDVNEQLTMEQMKARFPSHWLLIDEPVLDDQLNVLSGRLVYASPDRNDLHRRTMMLNPKDIAVLFTGCPPAGMDFVL